MKSAAITLTLAAFTAACLYATYRIILVLEYVP
jgi:hypothetical protein